MSPRSLRGTEAFRRLRDWTGSSTDSERLAALVVAAQGYDRVEPSQPLGGADGGKDILLRDAAGAVWICAVTFRRRPIRPAELKRKFAADLEGAAKNSVSGMVFVTNQTIGVRQRRALEKLASPTPVDFFDLNRLTHLVNSAPLYGVRLEFLDVALTKEELVAFLSSRDRVILSRLDAGLSRRDGDAGPDAAEVKRSIGDAYAAASVSPLYVPLRELREFKRELENPLAPWVFQIPHIPLSELRELKRELSDPFFFATVHVPHVPLSELRELKRELADPFYVAAMSIPRIPLSDLRAFKRELNEPFISMMSMPRVPLSELRDFRRELRELLNTDMVTLEAKLAAIRDALAAKDGR